MSTTPAVIPPFVATILKEYTDAIRPAIGFMLISAVFTAFLIPLFFLLLSMSTASSRKRPIFIINTLSIILGLVLGILSIHLSVTGILNPLVQSNAKEVFVYGVFFVWLPWITEFVLIFRVLVVYSAYSRTRLAMIIAFPVVMKLTRAGIFIHFLVLWKRLTATSTVQQYIIAEGVPRWIHESGWILELIDNMYISALFLWQLASQGHIFNGRSVGRQSDGGKYSVTNQLRHLFWIASTNLIFPIIFGVIEIAFLFQPQLQLTASMVYSANIYVSVVSIVFASVWASTSPFRDTAALENHQPAHNGNGSKSEKLEPLAFAGNASDGRQTHTFATISVAATESSRSSV